jgi:hypothetical protein
MLNRPSNVFAFSATSLALLATGIVWGILVRGIPITAPNDDWSLAELITHLHEAGLELRQVPSGMTGNNDNTAYLTTTAKGWEELACLWKAPERIADWKGTLYVEKRGENSDTEPLIELWGDCCLVVGPFVVFGDRELLARVRDALSV